MKIIAIDKKTGTEQIVDGFKGEGFHNNYTFKFIPEKGDKFVCVRDRKEDEFYNIVKRAMFSLGSEPYDTIWENPIKNY